MPGEPGSGWQRAYDASLKKEGERLHEATGGPHGCLAEAVTDFFGEMILALALCGGVAGVYFAFRAHPFLTSSAVTSVVGVTYLFLWNRAHRRGDRRPKYAAAGAILLGSLVMFTTWVSYCSCWT